MTSRRTTTFTLLVATMASICLVIALRHSRPTLRALRDEKQSVTGQLQKLTAERSSLVNTTAPAEVNLTPTNATQPSMLLEMKMTLAQIIASRNHNPNPPH